mgnify:CR=1 FL=1
MCVWECVWVEFHAAMTVAEEELVCVGEWGVCGVCVVDVHAAMEVAEEVCGECAVCVRVCCFLL